MKINKYSPTTYALYLLSRRDYGTAEINEKLEEKFGSEEAKKVVKFLEEKKFLDDRRFASNYIKLKSSLKGKQFIRQKLLRLKISTDIIEQAFESNYSENKEEESAAIIAERYIRKKEGQVNLYQKTGNFLLRRGFSYDTVKKVLQKIL